MKMFSKLFCVIFFASSVFSMHAQTTLYRLNWNDHSSFNNDCGYVSNSTFEVHNDSCSFTSNAFTMPETGNKITMDLMVSHVGKLSEEDKIYCYVWVNDRREKYFVVAGKDLAGDYKRTEEVEIKPGSKIYFKLCFVSSKPNRSWILRSGDLTATVPENEVPPVTANFNGRIIKLSWSKEINENSNYFIVERSADGQIFERVGLIKAENKKSNSFSIVDHSIKAGTNYYRVKLKDFSGSELAVGKIISINADLEITGALIPK